jgi:hypothetical protein
MEQRDSEKEEQNYRGFWGSQLVLWKRTDDIVGRTVGLAHHSVDWLSLTLFHLIGH